MSLLAKYANLSTIIVCAIMLAGGLLVGDRKLRAMETGIETAMALAVSEKAVNEKQDKIIAEQTTILIQLAAQVENIYKRGLVVQGKALVLDVGDKPYVELNNRDPNGPTRLAGFEHVHVMNLTHPDMFEGEMEIEGSFANATPNYVMNISKAAGVLLHARPGDWIIVRVRPHFEAEDK